MAIIRRSLANLGKNISFYQPHRTISITPVNQLKEIIERKEGNTLILEAKIVRDPKDERLLTPNKNGACLLCSAGVEVKHTDVLILSQFIRSDGCMMPKRVTGLCSIQQKRVSIMVTMAHRAGLLTGFKPKNCNNDPSRRREHKAFKTYYDEKTIKPQYYATTYRL